MKTFGILFLLMFAAAFTPTKGYSNLKNSTLENHSEKIYIELSSLYFSDEGIFLKIQHNEWAPIGHIHHDSQGFYLNDADIIECGSRVSPKPKRWRCPYCNHWWMMGEECQNEECPTNQWKQKNKEDS